MTNTNINTAASAQPVAQQGMTYAALPEWAKNLGGLTPTEIRHELHAFADATHALRVESLAAAYREELDKLSQRNYELRLASHGQAPASTSGDFIRRTNEDYAAWCATKYTPEFNSKGPDLHGLWAWQEQQRRMDDLLRQAPINLNCKSEQKRLATLWGFVPAQATPAYKDNTPELHIGDSAFESWYSTYSPAHKSDKQRARDAYAAGMGDTLVTAAPAAVAGPWSLGEFEGNWRDIDHKSHQGVIRIVWKMEGDERTLECETFALAVVDALNAAASTAQPARTAEVVECGNLYAKVKLHGDAFGSTNVGDVFYSTPQPAPQQSEVGISGFDHKTAADFLAGKTVSDEAMRKFVAASRWAHDDRAGLQEMLLTVCRELASRKAEIVLLKTSLMDAKAAPQQEAQSALFDKQGFHEWVLRNLPYDTIIGNSAYWAEHLSKGIQRFMKAAPQPTAQSGVEDTALLNWLNENIFYREMGEWDAKYGHGDGYNMWVLFSPKGVQGSARTIISAARAAQEGK